MSKFILEIGEIYNTIGRPVIMQIAEDVIRLTDFPKKAEIYFKGFSKQGINRESVMDKEEKETVNFSHKDRVIISAETKYVDPNIYSNQPYKLEYRPIFYDKEHSIMISPINYEVEVEMTLNFISKDRLTIERWRADIRRKIGQSIKSYLHQIEYTYPLDNRFIVLLKHLYDVKGINVPNLLSFEEWFMSNTLEKITGVVNQIGKGETVVIEQSQLSVVGIWSDALPEIEKMETGDLYQSNLTYLFRYSQPTEISADYPIILNNSIISHEFRLPCDYNDLLILGDPEKLVWGLNVTRSKPPEHYPCESVKLPCFDNWQPKIVPLGTAGVYTALITVDKEQRDYVMDLFDLGERYQLATWLKELILLFGEDCLIMGKSPVLVSLYRNDIWADFELLSLQEDYKLFTTTAMEFYNLYHVRLALYTDLTLLTEKTLNKLRVNGALCIYLFKTLAPEYIRIVPNLLSDGSIRKDDFWRFIRLIKNTNKNYKNDKEVRRFTVGSCVIATRREKYAVS